MKFYIKDNIIYKEITSQETPYLLKMSPWQIGEDRRVFNFNIKDYKSIKENKAKELINKQWDEDEREWNFNGEHYIVYNSINTKYKYTYSDIHKDKKSHEFIVNSTNINFRHHSFSAIYYLCMFQGRLYWAELLGGYYPQIKLYNFKDIDTYPRFNDFAQWTKSNHCKKVYKLNKKTKTCEVI